MTRWATVPVLAALAACGGAPRDDDRASVLRVVAQGRTALLHDDAAAACRLLTPHARRRVLGFQGDFRPEGSSRRRGVPRTCEQIAHAEFESDHQANVDPSWTPDVRRARFEVVSLRSDRARIRVHTPAPPVDLELVKTPDGWRIDDSDVVPSGD
jgi:hypothetical protein